jgi:signal transduction histidine kinase
MIEAMTSPGGRIAKRDVAIAAVFSLLGMLLMYENVTDPEVDANWLAIPAFLLITVPLAWRRVAPIAAATAALAGLLVHLGLFGTDVVRCGVVLPESFVLAFSAGTQLNMRESRIALAAALGLIVTEGAYFLGPFAVVPAVVAAAVWGTGRVVRSRGAMVEDLETRTSELREARDERARLEVATDRARLSGELDELLQRRLGELARLADGGAQPSDPAVAAATLADIERESRSTLEEMRAVVGVLREDSSEAPTSPQPALTNLEALLIRAKGADARLIVEGSPRVLPAGVELSAYRITEHLLAALDDAPEVDVRVRFADDAIELSVAGPARRGAKAAFERARERARLQHGTLEASTHGGRAEAVASLPVLARV